MVFKPVAKSTIDCKEPYLERFFHPANSLWRYYFYQEQIEKQEYEAKLNAVQN